MSYRHNFLVCNIRYLLSLERDCDEGSSLCKWSVRSSTQNIQSNFNGSNTLGTMKICSSQG